MKEIDCIIMPHYTPIHPTGVYTYPLSDRAKEYCDRLLSLNYPPGVLSPDDLNPVPSWNVIRVDKFEYPVPVERILAEYEAKQQENVEIPTENSRESAEEKTVTISLSEFKQIKGLVASIYDYAATIDSIYNKRK